MAIVCELVTVGIKQEHLFFIIEQKKKLVKATYTNHKMKEKTQLDPNRVLLFIF